MDYSGNSYTSKAYFLTSAPIFNDQVQGVFSKNVVTLKIHIFIFQLKAFQLKEKISLIPGEGLPAAIPSAFIFVRVFVAYALAAHAGFCFRVD